MENYNCFSVWLLGMKSCTIWWSLVSWLSMIQLFSFWLSFTIVSRAIYVIRVFQRPESKFWVLWDLFPSLFIYCQLLLWFNCWYTHHDCTYTFHVNRCRSYRAYPCITQQSSGIDQYSDCFIEFLDYRQTFRLNPNITQKYVECHCLFTEIICCLSGWPIYITVQSQSRCMKTPPTYWMSHKYSF